VHLLRRGTFVCGRRVHGALWKTLLICGGASSSEHGCEARALEEESVRIEYVLRVLDGNSSRHRHMLPPQRLNVKCW
jgi:hypothetical protein